MYFDDFDFDDAPEPYENDLEEWGNREAWEDAIAERESDYISLDEFFDEETLDEFFEDLD